MFPIDVSPPFPKKERGDRPGLAGSYLGPWHASRGWGKGPGKMSVASQSHGA